MATTPHSSMGVLTVLGGRLSMDNRMGGVSSVKMFDERNGVFRHSGQFRCMAGGSHNVKQYHSIKDSFLNLHPEVSMLRGSEKTNLQIGSELTRGLGAGGNPDIGMNALPRKADNLLRKQLMVPTWCVAALRENVDTLIVIPNDKLLTKSFPSTPHGDAFNLADDILRQGVRGISDIITVPDLVNVDFADVRAIMANAGSFAEKV
ncbi:hypothetical protein IFM89_000203 [Coptis chinensis]|uniref:Tubulin/FtsZ GTPase domain-containing protein n=1 Tax=Coptis chinensis TaxID=261450 RepID=A0A835I4J1_9MAGN|nr:hypothetical protein IFM89_000203 [Coptis chinensis]